MTNYKNVIAAFNMDDMQSMRYSDANFGRGRDKKKRKSRSNLTTAGQIGAGVAGAGLLGTAGLRYGTAAAAKRIAQNQMIRSGVPMGMVNATPGGRSKVKSDVKRLGRAIKNIPNNAKAAPGRAKKAVAIAGRAIMNNKVKSAAAVLGALAATGGGVYGVQKLKSKKKKSRFGF